MQFPRLLAALLLFLLACAPACREKPEAKGGAGQAQGQAQGQAGSESGKDIDGSKAMPVPSGDVRQVILIYTGDTISAMESQTQNDPPRGGLCALADTVLGYQREIVEFTAKRVENEGGDPSAVRADFDAGTLGPHPRLLLDYGGWERPNDVIGRPYEQLYCNYFKDFAYTAVGGMRYQELKSELWKSYRGLQNAPTLLLSSGTPRDGVDSSETLPIVDLITRECHGQKWGIACIPVPAPDELTPQNPSTAPLDEDYSNAANVINGAGCEMRILMAAGMPASFYKSLEGKTDFDIVIGGPVGLAVPEGMGDLPQSGPLLLPALEKAGRQIGICHLIYSTAGRAPTQYNFILRSTIASGSDKQPYYRQVEATRREHEAQAKKLGLKD
ncbi:hypothetical protein IT575_02705 [bacterium]|nr:hypothetical protein [bacterium]